MSESINPSTNPEPGRQPAGNEPDFRQELEALRAFAIKLQTALIALTIIIGMFVFVQFWRTKNELNQFRKFIAEQKQNEGAVNKFLTQLVEYARTHPDFVPVLSKYPIQIQQSPTSAVPTTATAPKPAASAPAPATTPGTAPKK